MEFQAVPYTVVRGGIEKIEAWIVSSSRRAIIRIRDHDRTESDDETIDALMKKAERGPDELGPLISKMRIRGGA